MNKILIIFVLLVSFLSNGIAQDIKFNKRSIDLGEVQYWSKSPAIFLYTNNTNQKLALLRIDTEQNIKAKFKIRYLKPGETDSIIVFYIPKERGSFNSNLLVYASTASKPYKLRISGNIIGLDECPGSEIIEEYKVKHIKVVDKISQKPISKVKVETIHMYQTVDKNHTRLDGMFKIDLKPSLYEFVAEHPDYQPLAMTKYVRISEKVILLELEKVQSDPVIVSTEIYEEKTEETKDEASKPDEFEIVFEEQEVEDEKAEKEPEIVEIVKDTVNKELPTHIYKRNNIVFLIDVSSSMRRRDRMPVLKIAMNKLIDILRPVDDVSLITYSSKSQVLLEGVAADQKYILYEKVDSIEAKGLTYGVVGLKSAYEIAEKNYKNGANNQVIIATDGQFNSPDHSQLEMTSLIRSYANKGISLSIIGFGEESKYLRRMRNMARIGKGNFIHITDQEGVENLLVEEVKSSSRKN